MSKAGDTGGFQPGGFIAPDYGQTDQIQLTPRPTTSEISINKVENGFIVHVGCKVFTFSHWSDASEALRHYFENPEEARKKYCRQSK